VKDTSSASLYFRPVLRTMPVRYSAAMSTQPAFFSDDEIELARRSKPFDRDGWLKQGTKLGREHGDRQWEIGKWLDEGFGALGKKAAEAEAMRVTKITKTTLWDYARTFECFPEENSRRRELSWSHHKELSIKALSPEKRAKLLGSAVAGPWSLQRLRTEVRNELKKDKGNTKSSWSLTVRVTEGTYQYLEKLARASDKSRAELAGELLEKYIKTISA
jgi:hypothetical protein